MNQLTIRAYLNYGDEWKKLQLPNISYSSIDNCWNSIRKQFPNAQIRLEWTYKEDVKKIS